jgi:2-dehydro-3-deoxygalactonokinase
MTRPRLLAIDWGTSNLRAGLLGDGGVVLESRAAAGGVMAVPERRFAETLNALCGDWIEQIACPAIASGMVGSRQGWREAPYVDCPAGLAQVAAHDPDRADTARRAAHWPALHRRRRTDDVMRGEETQLWGRRCRRELLRAAGTRSKWAWAGEAARSS